MCNKNNFYNDKVKWKDQSNVSIRVKKKGGGNHVLNKCIECIPCVNAHAIHICTVNSEQEKMKMKGTRYIYNYKN